MIKNTFYLLLLGSLAFSCKKEEPTPETPTPPTPETEEYFISAKINGTLWKAVNTENGCQIYYGQSASVGDSILLDYESSFMQEGLVSPITSPLSGTLSAKMSNFKHEFGEYTDSDVHFNNAFTTGSKTYHANGTVSPGAEITYHDAQGELWSTRFGSQSGSTFSVTSVTSGTLGPDKVKYVKATFTGKIYSESAPAQFKTITEGSFFMIFAKY